MSNDTEERDRGILTPTDRAFLRGEKEYKNEETAVHRRADIRQRIRDSIADFTLLAEELPEKDRKKVFENSDTEPFSQGLKDSIAFIVMALGNDIQSDSYEINLPRFRSVLRGGLERALGLMGYTTIGVSPDLGIQAYDKSTTTELKTRIVKDESSPFSDGHLLVEYENADKGETIFVFHRPLDSLESLPKESDLEEDSDG